MLPSISPTQVILLFLLMAWLGTCMVFDLRSRQVPALLTILPLVLSALWRLFQGGWSVVILVVALILISDFPWPKWRIPLACLATVLALSIPGPSESIYALLVIFAAWALWEIGATGWCRCQDHHLPGTPVREWVVIHSDCPGRWLSGIIWLDRQEEDHSLYSFHHPGNGGLVVDDCRSVKTLIFI